MPKSDGILCLSDQQEQDKQIVSKNLREIRDYMGWKQTNMAELTQVSEPAMGNYLNGERIPSVSYLKRLCLLPEIKEAKLEITVDMLMSPDFRPEMKEKTDRVAHALPKNIQGSYLTYFLDQSKDIEKMSREELGGLRVGVLTVTEGISEETGLTKLIVHASFYKEEQGDAIARVKKEVDKILEEKANAPVGEREAALKAYFDAEPGDSCPYIGELTVTSGHLYIDLVSEAYQDKALMIFSQPEKREDRAYIGGLGCVASVSHGQVHKPTGQSILLTRYELDRSYERVRELLWDFPTEPECTAEAMEVTKLAKLLYEAENETNSVLDDDDKSAIIANRMHYLLRHYVNKRVGYINSITPKAEYKAYELILKQKKASLAGGRHDTTVRSSQKPS